ncbi:rab11 family-interacting protein 4B isoform X1 [Drosophila sulfurigaster albostrigata]|uniref:Rab11 family-interacting protein 4B isoform X4 n=1 Tax=Drosophila albomicans TaxID=7291 RepID=A0A9C6WFN0_DROAB|nr:rab11 family-interacting protein 4B isoform X4 [Drosophila albomicans]XP_060655226.1 rab11 family-interacting protein 4B isoform X4 [Drosophila nasuta]XP_062133993.1 rab11 family-interacting protein 4B isoform X1 [Drosophila sulfurigaster albostrigata]
MAPMPRIQLANSNAAIKASTNNFLYAETVSGDSSPTPSSPPSSTAGVAKSQCSSLSDGESFEGYGENEYSGQLRVPGGSQSNSGGSHNNNNNNSISGGNGSLCVSNGNGVGHSGHSNDGNNNLNDSAGIELDLAPHVSSSPKDDEELNIMPRDNWARRSLRRTPTSNPDSLSQRRWGSMRHSGRRQISSNALASQLYRSSSFNSSGRSSNCDTTEDMYSDISLENRHDYDYRLELLQRKVDDLSDTQNIAEDRTTRTKTEYAVLQARYHMLEEQYRESELRAEERLAEEQKRHREILARVEREASLQNENCQMKIKATEIEANALRDEAQRLRVLCDKQANDLHRTEEQLELARDQIAALQQEYDEQLQTLRRHEQEKKSTEELMLELSHELQRAREENGARAMPTTSPESIRLEELHQELEEMRQKNRSLEEQNEELQATMLTNQATMLTNGVEQGRHLLSGTLNNLAQELEEMSQAQLQQAFQEKEDENVRLKHYIDTILLNIVENYPQLLEVKPIERK